MAEKIDAGRVPELTVNYYFTQTPDYRVIHVDGAFGGPTPQGNLFLGLFSEHFPLPERVSHHIAGGKLSDELPEHRVTRDGIIREVEVGVVMDLQAAKALHDWLGANIKAVDEKSGHNG